MITPGPEVTMATALAQSPSLPSESNPVQIRYEHHTEELNHLGLYLRNKRLCGKLTAIYAVYSDSRLKLTLQTAQRMFLKPLCRLQTKCLFSVSFKKKKNEKKNWQHGPKRRGREKGKGQKKKESGV